MKLNIVIAGKTFEVEVEEAEQSIESALSAPTSSAIYSSVLPTAPKPGTSSEVNEAKVCRSPLAGVVVRLHVKPGDSVRVNDLLLVLDAMKMEIKINAQSAGIIKSIEVAPTEAVRPGQVLVCYE
ncbi:MAG TPA: biotin/lipoyl-containing protein [Terriglobales bacterium]